MRIAFDVHGVMADRPDLFKPLLKLFKKNNIEIFVLSGPTKNGIIEELDSLGYTNEHYDHILSVVDYLKAKNVEMWKDKKNTWWTTEEYWLSSKGEICELYDIDLIFDDNEQYKAYMPKKTLFILFEDKKNKNKLTRNIKI